MSSSVSDKVLPINGFIVIDPLHVEAKSSGGIIIPETAMSKSKGKQARVVASCDMVDAPAGQRTCRVRVGDVVLYDGNADEYAPEVEVERKKYKVIREADVYAVLR